MEALLPTLALLACPVGMGLLMFVMARSNRSSGVDSAPTADGPGRSSDQPMSLEVLREEHLRLGEEIDRMEAPASGEHEPAKHR